MRRLQLLIAAAIVVGMSALPAALASGAGPVLKVSSSAPNYVVPGKSLKMFLTVFNAGNQPLSEDVHVRYELPAGIVPAPPQSNGSSGVPDPSCTITGQVVDCTAQAAGRYADASFTLVSTLLVESGAEGVLSASVEVSGGGSGEVVREEFSLDTAPIGPFAIHQFGIHVEDGDHFPSTQVGAAPSEIRSAIKFDSVGVVPFELPIFTTTAPTESFRNVIVHVPVGLIGNPGALSASCEPAQLTSAAEPGGFFLNIPQCPAASQVGLVELFNGQLVPLFDMQPPQGAPAQFGFFFASSVITLTAKVRPSDNGIDLITRNSPSSVPIPSFEVTMWGVPADPSHDRLRTVCLQSGAGYNPAFCSAQEVGARAAFLRNPTSCAGEPLHWRIEMDSYQHPGTFVSKETSTPAPQGCSALPFDPDMSLTPSERAANSPSGLDVQVTMPQETGPDGLAEADLKSATVSLPQGVVVNQSAADGLGACTDQQLGLGEEQEPSCPDASKLGSLEVRSPLVREPISGSVYIRSSASEDPESGDLYRLALVLHSDRYGVDIKLPGQLRVSEKTGRIAASFNDLPQLPFESMQLHLKNGPRAPLITPGSCGTYSAHAEFEGWNGKAMTLDPGFTIDRNCTTPDFRPGMEAGTQRSIAGAYAPLTLRVTRDPGMPNLSRIETTLPEGLLAKLAGIPVCPEGQTADGECPAASRIGHVTVGIGDGPNPLFLPQQGKRPTAVYLAGPYKGAPYSVVVAVPAQAGPFDLGVVTVRSALHVDPRTTRATVTSDALPQIRDGIPVTYRDVRVEIDRPEFTLNGTNCEPLQVDGTLDAITGASANVSDRFQLSDCAHLGFKPKLSLALKGKTRRGGNPALTAMLTFPQKGTGANTAKAQVALPHSEFLAQAHIKTICTRVQYAAGPGGGVGCPKGSVYGQATAWSPLLDRPLSGPVYLRSSNNPLPDLVASLGGQIQVDLVGRIDSKNGGIRTTFAQVPDAPVSKFVLKMPSGKKSLLENSTNICRGEHRATVKFDAQNGKFADFNPELKVGCGKGHRGKH